LAEHLICQVSEKQGASKMSRFLRNLLGAMIALGLAVSLLGSARPAAAAPRPQSPLVLSPTTPDGAGRLPSYRFEYRKLSKAKRTDARAAVNIIRNSVSNKGKTLNYTKANKYDKAERPHVARSLPPISGLERRSRTSARQS
jgi:hypothetical protein